MRAAASALSILALVLGAGQALAAPPKPIGATVSVINLVTGEVGTDIRTLAPGDSIHQNENIAVGTDASTELKLDDETKLALGSGAQLKLDKFVYNPDKASGSIALDLIKGAFRFMTGVASKPSYVVHTPNAAITVRGTIFDVFIRDDNTTWVLLHEGAVRICNFRGECRDHAQPGKLVLISDTGVVGKPVKWSSLPGKDDLDFDTAFPFVGNPPSVDPDPIFKREAILDGTLKTEPGKTTTKKAEAGDDAPEATPASTDYANSKGKASMKPASAAAAYVPSSRGRRAGVNVPVVIPGAAGYPAMKAGYAPKAGLAEAAAAAAPAIIEAIQNAHDYSSGRAYDHDDGDHEWQAPHGPRYSRSARVPKIKLPSFGSLPKFKLPSFGSYYD